MIRAVCLALALLASASASNAAEIVIHDAKSQPESMAVGPDGTLYVGSASTPYVYTVKKGDTLWKIAEEHYGKGQGAKYTEIVKANTPPVKNPDLIMPGWVLRIPPLG